MTGNILEAVKAANNITGNDQDAALNEWINEVIEFIKDAGVSETYITSGLVARGVTDLWDYGSGTGKLSEYFRQRVTQLAYK